MSGWQTTSLDQVAAAVDYGVTASAINRPVGPKFLRITDIQDGAVNWQNVPWCECHAGSATGARLKAGDIVFARTGATTGKSFLIRDCPPDAVFASYLIRVRVGDGAEPRFVSHFFQTPDYWAQITKSARGVAQPGVNATTLKALKIPLPPLPEQRRIAEVLDRAEALRAKRRAALVQLNTLTQAIFLDMFGDPLTNSMRWRCVELAGICKRVTVGIVVKPASYYVPRGVPALRSLNIKPGKILLEDLVYVSESANETKLAKTQLKADDIVLVRSGQPGTAAVVPVELDGVNAIDLLIATPERTLCDSTFLCAFLNSTGGRDLVLRRQRGQVQKHLNAGSLNQAIIPLPPVELQRDFARRVSGVDSLETIHRSSEIELDALFASLQHRAFRGEL